MRVVVTGVTGQLGFDVMRELTVRGIGAYGATRQEMPLTEPVVLHSFIEEKKPEVVIHCAAYTAVAFELAAYSRCRTALLFGIALPKARPKPFTAAAYTSTVAAAL